MMRAVKSRGVHLQYRFEAEAQQGPQVRNPLFAQSAPVKRTASRKARGAPVSK